MRYSSAVVLSTLAVGQAAASNLHNRHASFHARRQAEAKRSAGSDVDWNAVAYDLKDVDWDAVNWNSVFSSTPAAAATPVPTPEQKKVSAAAAPTPVVEAKKETPTSAAVVASSTKVAEKPAESSKAAAPSASTQSTSDIVSDLMQGVATIAGKLGCKTGKNDKSNNGGIWIGSDSAWGMEVTNSGSKEAVFYCWKANGFSGMSININVPEVSVGLKPGQKVDLSFAPNVPAACAPAKDSSTLAIFGGLYESWAEVTFGQYGAFDVSRNVNMHGSNISMQGSICKSDMETCVFKCKDSSVQSCETGYDLFNCNAGNGGGGGYDVVMQGTGGGCSMGQSGEKIKVSFS